MAVQKFIYTYTKKCSLFIISYSNNSSFIGFTNNALRKLLYISIHICRLSDKLWTSILRDRPFNLKGGGGYGFLFRSEYFFRTTQELEYLLFLSRKARNFFPGFNSRLYDKNSESDYFLFPPPKSEYFF